MNAFCNSNVMQSFGERLKLHREKKLADAMKTAAAGQADGLAQIPSVTPESASTPDKPSL